MEHATELLLEICGGQAGPVIESVSNEHLPATQPITMRKQRIQRVLGLLPADDETVDILERFDGEIVRGQLVQAEDPRASGELSMVESLGVAFSEAPSGSRSVADVRARSIRLENEAGAWEGTGWGASYAPESPTQIEARKKKRIRIPRSPSGRIRKSIPG